MHTPPGLPLADALSRLEPAVAPFERVTLRLEDVEQLVHNPDAWAALRRLPLCVGQVEALGTTFDLRDPVGAGLWRLALRLLSDVGDG